MTTQFYQQVLREIEDRISGEHDVTAITANTSAILHISLNKEKGDSVNWTGFYITRREGQLVLGPFQGKPACQRINFESGVCGAAATTQISQVVPDVHLFPGHISCDCASKSEIVVPIIVEGNTVGVIDIDSSELGTFTEEDRVGLEEVAKLLASTGDWSSIKEE
eukprot:TRINITY_DN7283_c0_g1_i1.p1 TRINITY_DN7283_c0_g1~~TRINITY_DN7283_c0_g1_i1.p1  ORF type:complete len:165 (-),score=35.74 TRINITY_DN7283_c0_g1_i1:41-535(-)